MVISYQYFINTFLMYLIGLSIFVPIMIWLVKPFLNIVLHGTSMTATQTNALSFEKMFYFILFASLWITAILWLQKFIPWYRKLRKRQDNSEERMGSDTIASNLRH